ncbi:ribosome biogenesis GTP-binding protein YihA/YsxC [Algiphilus aromaticivorans]|uniref:ribosome biogenesis GTP-binding protein YihA/YsxC n=1 Tax=Algiphilus aromaticivorans TaxID=382454 RepID=UPI0005C23FF1|nr:ribosome biogenesis GTP-binding protein YihA/YsxC [Algiphilus aromaticivorans]
MSDNPFPKAEFLRSCARHEQLPTESLPEIAFAGRSNAGKSSALNKICQRRKLARTSKTPGRTQLLNIFSLPGGHLVDLPGYGYANVPEKIRREWNVMVGGYIASRDQLVGIALIMDIRHPLTPHDEQMLTWAESSGRRVHVLLTKADKFSRGRAANVRQQVQKALGERATCQTFSAADGSGCEQAQTKLGAWLKGEPGL